VHQGLHAGRLGSASGPANGTLDRRLDRDPAEQTNSIRGLRLPVSSLSTYCRHTARPTAPKPGRPPAGSGRPVFVVFVTPVRQEVFRVMEGVGSRLAVIQMGWRNPFGRAVFAFSGGPRDLRDRGAEGGGRCRRACPRTLGRRGNRGTDQDRCVSTPNMFGGADVSLRKRSAVMSPANAGIGVLGGAPTFWSSASRPVLTSPNRSGYQQIPTCPRIRRAALSTARTPAITTRDGEVPHFGAVRQLNSAPWPLPSLFRHLRVLRLRLPIRKKPSTVRADMRSLTAGSSRPYKAKPSVSWPPGNGSR